MQKHSISEAMPWDPPTEESFRAMKRYKSFLMPPNVSYAVGEFVWLAHENARPSTSSPPRKKSRSRASIEDDIASSQSVIDMSQIDADDGDDEDTEEVKERKETDAMWKAGYWIGRIVEIRAIDRFSVWMRIRWMSRTVKELRDHDVRSGLPKGRIGGREIFMLGPESDALQPVGAVEARAKVVLYDESNPLQEPFDDRSIFFRSEARTPRDEEVATIQRNIKKPGAKARHSDALPCPKHLFPYQGASCYCGNPYLPLGDRPEPMALCPHPGCLKWFHLGCLDWRSTHRRVLNPSSLKIIRSAGLHLLSLHPSSSGAAFGSSNTTGARQPISSSNLARPLAPGQAWFARMLQAQYSDHGQAPNHHGYPHGPNHVFSHEEMEKLCEELRKQGLEECLAAQEGGDEDEGDERDVMDALRTSPTPAPEDVEAEGGQEDLLPPVRQTRKVRTKRKTDSAAVIGAGVVGVSPDGARTRIWGDEEERDGNVPEVIQRVAEGLILRGGKLGVVGNALKVLRARAIVQKAASSSPPPAQRRTGFLFNPGNSGKTGETEGSDPEFGFEDEDEDQEDQHALEDMVDDWKRDYDGILQEEARGDALWACPTCKRFI